MSAGKNYSREMNALLGLNLLMGIQYLPRIIGSVHQLFMIVICPPLCHKKYSGGF